jgi:hypothetical protein
MSVIQTALMSRKAHLVPGWHLPHHSAYRHPEVPIIAAAPLPPMWTAIGAVPGIVVVPLKKQAPAQGAAQTQRGARGGGHVFDLVQRSRAHVLRCSIVDISAAWRSEAHCYCRTQAVVTESPAAMTAR